MEMLYIYMYTPIIAPFKSPRVPNKTLGNDFAFNRILVYFNFNGLADFIDHKTTKLCISCNKYYILYAQAHVCIVQYNTGLCTFYIYVIR